MAGHNKWKQIKERKGKADKVRSAVFSKHLRLIAVAARPDPNPEFNPRLRSAIERAKNVNVPNENIQRAVNRALEEKNLEEIRIEAYGPEGVQVIVEAITDNRNRTIAEVRSELQNQGAKMADPGSVVWAFENTEAGWQSKFPQAISATAKAKLAELVEKLENHPDVLKTFSSAK